MRVLFVFLDGVGLGEDDVSRNVFVASPMPVLRTLLGGAPPLWATAPVITSDASLHALDASFGVDGLPQSGTGQAALLTGLDAVGRHGRHFGPWVPSSLRTLVREDSVLARVKRAGLDIAFANAYPEEAIADAGDRQESGARARRSSHFLMAGPPLAALGAGVLVRHTAALRTGDAIASEITNEAWRTRLGRTDLPHLTARDAGRNLVRIAGAHDLTLFAHYGTDYAGHLRSMDAAVAAVERVDAFLAGIVDSMPDDVLLVVASDHGNIEDVRQGHTTNPALGLVVGKGHAQIGGEWSSLVDVVPSILRVLGIADAGTPAG